MGEGDHFPDNQLQKSEEYTKDNIKIFYMTLKVMK